MAFNILQWNIRGYINNYNELLLLIKDLNPDVLCLQETHIPYGVINVVTPKQYIGYFFNLPSNFTAKQGVGVLVKSRYPHKVNFPNSNILAMNVDIDLNIKFTIINTYIPPSTSFSEQDICRCFSDVKNEFILLGDFNSWSNLWGSLCSNSKGTIIENVILSNNLILLNDGSATHFNTRKSFTHVDLTMATPRLSTKCNWKIEEFLHGSDHFPIIVEIGTSLTISRDKRPSNYLTDKANWNLYKATSSDLLYKGPLININHEVAKLTKAIRSASNKSIPRSTPFRPKKYSYWWNNEIANLRREKQSLWRSFKCNRSDSCLIAYKKATARFKKAVKDAKKICLENFTKRITPLSNAKAIWNSIKTMTGSPKPTISMIKHNHNMITNPVDIANLFGSYSSCYSKDSNFHSEYLNNKTFFVSYCHMNVRPSKSASCLEENFTLSEMEHALQFSKGKTPGRDRISYPLLKNLPLDFKKRILCLYNKV